MAQTEVTPVAQQPRVGKVGDACAMVIFGAAGDLTQRKLIPALYNLAKSQVLSREFAIVGVARAQMSTDDFRNKLSQDIKQFATEPVDADLWEWFVRRMYYLSGNFDDKNIYPQLKDLLDKVDKDHNTHGNHFYYLATAANFFGPIVEQLAATGLMEENQRWRRVIV
jgi:glucose-6-phosphate 1-dehydrogenase